MKAILTVIGKDKPGIIAKVSTALAKDDINIEDISQTVLQDKFTMIMMVDISKCKITLSELVKKFALLGKELGVEIYLQHEDVFNAIYNI